MREKISNLQAIILVAQTITPTAILFIPAIVIRAASQDAWLSVVIAIGCGVIFAMLIGSICRHNPGLPFLTFMEKRLGRVVSVIAGIVFVQYYLGNTAIILREFVDFLSSELLLKTPVFVLAVISLLVVWYAVKEGIEVIARISVIVFVIALLFLMLGVGLQFNQVDFKHLFPVGEATLPQLIEGGIPSYGWMSQTSIMLLLSPYLLKPAQARKVGIIGVFIAGCHLLLIVVLVLFVFGPELPKIMAYPTFASTEIIKYGNFVERVDLMFIAIWISTIYIKLCVFFFGTVHCFVHLFRIRFEKPFHIALGVVVLLTALYSWPSNAHFARFQALSMSPFLLTANVLFPFALWLALQLRKRKHSETGG